MGDVMANYDSWKTHDPADDELGPEPPPCERPFPPHMPEQHCRYPSGFCVECGAEAHQRCKHENHLEYERYQRGEPEYEYPDEEF
jgi:hypothetical protein